MWLQMSVFSFLTLTRLAVVAKPMSIFSTKRGARSSAAVLMYRPSGSGWDAVLLAAGPS